MSDGRLRNLKRDSGRELPIWDFVADGRSIRAISTAATLIAIFLVSAYIILEWLVDSWLAH
jgi:hypothetical protein